jgi:hypothetical protein
MICWWKSVNQAMSFSLIDIAKVCLWTGYGLVVVLAGTLFAMQNDGKMRSFEAGAYDHCGEFDNLS